MQDVLLDPKRLARLHQTELLDAPTEEAFDRLTRLAAKLLEAPLSTVTLVDSDRQFYMSCTGFPEPLASLRQTPLEFSFCKHTVVLGRPLIIPDVRGHPLVGDNPAITQFGVTAYAGIPLLTSGGEVLGTLCVMDFGVRHWTEEQVASLTDLAAAVSTEIELRLDIQERRRVEEELLRTVHLRDEVLGVVSHDLRNPVHTITLAAGLLEELLPQADTPPLLQQQLAIIRRAAGQMERQIRDLLDVASIESGKLSLEPVSLDARAMVSSALAALRPLVEEARLVLESEFADIPLPVHADPTRIEQLLSNLVGNATKFTPAGGHLRVRLFEEAGEVRLSVTDTGPGIEAEEVPHLFRRFWQGRPAGRHGAGLGLAISKGIAEAHGGRIWVESTPGAGSTFHVALPLAS